MNTYEMNEEVEVRCDETYPWVKRTAIGMTLDGLAVIDKTFHSWKHHRKQQLDYEMGELIEVRRYPITSWVKRIYAETLDNGWVRCHGSDGRPFDWAYHRKLQCYEIDEEIQVREDPCQEWVTRRFREMVEGRAVCVNYAGESVSWKHHRKLQKPTLIPWTPEDIKADMRLRRPHWTKGVWSSPSYAGSAGVILPSAGKFQAEAPLIPYADLLEQWETFDGKPCGKEAV